jgi:hypothetical protein
MRPRNISCVGNTLPDECARGLRRGQEPAAESELERPTPGARDEHAPPLRAELPRTLSPARTSARLARAAAMRRTPISDQALAHHLGVSSDRAGAQIRSGAAPLDLGEAAKLLPPRISVPAFVELIDEQLSCSEDPLDVVALNHLRSAAALLGLRHAA